MAEPDKAAKDSSKEAKATTTENSSGIPKAEFVVSLLTLSVRFSGVSK